MALRNTLKKILGVNSWNSDEDQKRLLPDTKIILDVGANVGQTTASYRQLFPKSSIWSFEPFPETYNALKKVTDKSPKSYAVNAALSDTVGDAYLNVGAGSLTNSLLQRETHSGTVKVQTDTIDNFCRVTNIPSVHILKIDVEGAESKVLDGAQFMLSHRLIQAIFLEVYFNPVYEGMPLFSDLDTKIKGHGFRLHGLYSLVPDNTGKLSYGNALYILAE
jgi:FkbM family methyltransferase